MSDRKTDPHLARGSFRLGEWRVEPQRNVVSDGAREIRLEPKVMEVLLCLAVHAGDVVPRRVIVDTVWAAEFISDTTLTHAVAELRRALGDSPRSPRFIETIPKRGYRLAAGVEWPDRPDPGPAPRAGAAGLQPLAVIAGDSVHLGADGSSGASEHALLCGVAEIRLTRAEIVIGRAVDCDIQLLASDVSRRHARLELADGQALVADLGSKNGTLVNDQPFRSPRHLATGDALTIGATRLVYRRLVDEATRTRED